MYGKMIWSIPKILGSLKKQLEWLIVDHYGLDAKWRRDHDLIQKRLW